jgi:homocysteine S-methyltransferase
MHTGSEIIGTALEDLKRHFKGPLMVYPDSGYFEMPGWRFVDIIPPHEYGVFARQWLASGVQLLGGCCGLGLPHIEEAVRAADEFRKSR